VARVGDRRVSYRVLVGKLEGMGQLGRPRRRGKDGIKMELQEVRWGARTGLFWLRIRTAGGLL
jgi:hypothetical protein